jgi:hypothetical protein
VPYGGGLPLLTAREREQLDRREEGLAADQRADAVANLRLLFTAFEQGLATQDDSGIFSVEYSEIFAEPYDADHLFLAVRAPDPEEGDDGAWAVEICRWEPDNPDEEGADEYGNATGKPVLQCLLASVQQAGAGDPLAGTKFVVTTVNR